MAFEKLRVILIAGCGRSGSTVLDNILGQKQGFFSGGELGNLSDFVKPAERVCACGTRFRECEVWQGILRRLFGEVPNQGAFISDTRDPYRWMRLKDLWRLTTANGRKRFLRFASEHAQGALQVYREISAETGAHTIVDSTKNPARTYLITQIPELDTYVIHLVRDARAVAFSWRRKKPDPSLPNTYMDTYSPANTALRWILSQQVERLCNVPGHYLMLRYEDFVAAPDRAMEFIFTLIGESVERRPRIVNHTVCLDRVHSINGNPSRFSQQTVILKPDEEWRSKMNGFDRAVVSALAWPLLRQYGYELNGGLAAKRARRVAA
jgi:hypothetical protein